MRGAEGVRDEVDDVIVDGRKRVSSFGVKRALAESRARRGSAAARAAARVRHAATVAEAGVALRAEKAWRRGIATGGGQTMGCESVQEKRGKKTFPLKSFLWPFVRALFFPRQQRDWEKKCSPSRREREAAAGVVFSFISIPRPFRQPRKIFLSLPLSLRAPPISF
jgi:hypothetical protein